MITNASWVLIVREWKRYLRQRSRVVSTLLTPAILWIFLGLGFGENYLEFFFPGVLLMVLLFSAIFSMISVIEDRNEGFLQSVMVSPVSHVNLLVGKIVGSASLAVLHAVALLPLLVFFPVHISIGRTLSLIAVFFLVALFLCALSFLFAWKLNSSQGFHAFMNVLLFPMWLLSGAMFPPGKSSSWIQWVIDINPLKLALDLIRNLLYGSSDGFVTPILILSVCCVALVGYNFFLVKKSYQ